MGESLEAVNKARAELGEERQQSHQLRHELEMLRQQIGFLKDENEAKQQVGHCTCCCIPCV